MFARFRPVPFAISLLAHGLVLAWVASGPLRDESQSLYAQSIAPRSSKLVWYNFREKLPDVSPSGVHTRAKPPRAGVKLLSQRIVADLPKAPHARQFVWQPTPKPELHAELVSPNVLALHSPHSEQPPAPRAFLPPAEKAIPGMLPAKAPPRKFVAPSAGRPLDRLMDKSAPMLPDAPPVVAAAHTALGVPSILGGAIAKPAPREFAAPSPGAKPSPFASSLPDAPELPESGSAPVSVAIVSLNPSPNAPPPKPEGSRNAQFSAGPEPHGKGAADGSVEGAIITVPGLLIRGGLPDAKPTVMARAAPTSAANLRAALRGSLPATSIDGPHAAIRVSSAPDPEWIGRDTYALSVSMPNITSYTGSWMIWFAERREESAAGGVLRLPVPLRKVDPKYFPAAIADRVEGKVRLAAVIRKDGRVDSVRLLQHLDDRLDQSAKEAMDKWQFEPALRDGQPEDVDAVIEIPFRLAPKTNR